MIPETFYKKLDAVKHQYDWKLVKSASYQGDKTFYKIRGSKIDSGIGSYCPLQAVYGTYYFNEENEKFSAEVIACSDHFEHYPEFSEENRKVLLEKVGLK